MSFDWGEYLGLAEELTSQSTARGSREARLRSSVSRAYYAAFCTARNELTREGQRTPRGGEVHGFVRDRFQAGGDPRRGQVALDLDRLRKSRNQADYDDDFPGLEKSAGVALAWAKNAMETLRRLGSS